VTVIKKLKLENFKKFTTLDIDFDLGKNILIGDNEAGKSTVLLAIDLVLAASRNRVEAIGLESLISKSAVDTFLAGKRALDRLPVLYVELWLSEGTDFELNGKNNSMKIEADGLRMEISPIEEYSKTIKEILSDDEPNFPYEYYGIKFTLFSGESFASFKRPLTHIALDSSRIDSENAVREYTRSVFGLYADVPERSKLENQYRRGKETFRDLHLSPVNSKLTDFQFGVRSGSRSNLEADLVITEDGIPLDSRGKGRQCFLKTEFALSKHKAASKLNVLLLEEPENHLSHSNMKRLVHNLTEVEQTQLFIATHSSHISSRLDLRRAILLGLDGKASSLKDLSQDTADFFIKAPDNNVLEFALSKKVVLLEGDAEFILFEALYRNVTGGITPEADNVHVLAIGGTSFKRYLELGKLLGIKTAAVRDNDGDFHGNCLENYDEHIYDHGKIFADADDRNRTFEISLCACNTQICDDVFATGRKTLTVLEYMLKNKADAALKLLNAKQDELKAPTYIEEAIKWIRG
jgi:putative ATP-dependent endonuclease of the OLD family